MYRQTFITTLDSHAAIPQLAFSGYRKTMINGRYQRRTVDREPGIASVQISIDGYGIWRNNQTSRNFEPFTTNHVLMFCAGEHDLTYGRGQKLLGDFTHGYLAVKGEPALAWIRQLIARHGHFAPIQDPWRILGPLSELWPQSGSSNRMLSIEHSSELAFKSLLSLSHELEGPNRSTAERLVEKAKALFREQMADCTVDSVAQSLGVSREYLSRQFRHQGEKSPGVWLRECRLAMAAELIRDGDQTLEEIAHWCGFNSYSHFCRLFKQHMRCAPSAYRKRSLLTQ